MINLEMLERILTYIDDHLSDDITFRSLAETFGYSPFHFHRIFTSVTGRTITDYLKKRRLAYACRQLVETDKPITSICYDCGFHSIQTFNRLFKNSYGSLPSEVRGQCIQMDCPCVQTIISGYKKRVHFDGDFIMEPRFVERDGFTIAGIRRYTGDGWHVIGEAWGELKENMDKIQRRNPNISYGFEDYSEDFIPPDQFYYTAAVEINSESKVPKGWYQKRIPQSRYAVFTVNGNNAKGEIHKAFMYIYNVWLPNSEYCIPEELQADFEFYDERWDCQSVSSQVDLYIPVKRITEYNH